MHPQPIHIAHATIYMSPPTELLPLQVAGVATDNVRSLKPTANALTPPALGEVWPGQGGIRVATIPAMLGMPARHVIASSEEISLKFGPYVEVPGASSHVDGRANTGALFDHDDDHPAAQWAHEYTADGHTDFFLPARFDLLMAHLQAPQAFKDGWHWTSTQGDRSSAFAQHFTSGYSGWNGKDFEFRVRAVRTIQL
jgi:hypothetical protein